MANVDYSKVSKFFRESGLAKNALNSVKSNEETFMQKLFKGAKTLADDAIGDTRVGEALFETSQVRGAAKGERVAFDMSKPAHQEIGVQLYKESAEHSNTIQEAMKALENSGKVDSKEYEELLNMKKALRGEDGTGGMMGDLQNALQTGGKLEYEEEAKLYDKIKNTGGKIKDYYTKGDSTDIAIKSGVTLGAYAAGAVGLRYLSGGTFTTNNNGESDIAGIPFI